MAYPDTLDSLNASRAVGDTGPTADNNAQAVAIMAIEAKLGVDDSTVKDSIDHKLAKVQNDTLNIYRPTKFAYNEGVLQKQDFGSTTWTDFTIKGINAGMTPPGFDPNTGRSYDTFSNLSQVKWFADEFSAIGGNAIRVYANQVPSTGTQGVMGQLDVKAWNEALDVLHDNGIYVLIDLYVNFFAAYNTAALTEWYKNEKAMEMVKVATQFNGHPAVMGYLFGNETNLSGNLASAGMNLNAWWNYANEVAGEVRQIDTNHIVGISSGLGSSSSISGAITAENNGLLDNFDFHGANSYRGGGWTLPVAGGSDFFDGWNPTNEKPIIVTETGVDAYDNDAGEVDESAQSTAAEGLWDDFDRNKCAGIFFFAAFDELWKTGNANGNPVVAGDNASIHSTRGFSATTDDFYMPDGFANEQYFGWWTPITARPYSNPPTARAVVASMAVKWSE